MKPISIIQKLNESTENEVKFSGVEFEKNIPHEMRFKEYDTMDDELYWVTQEPFTKKDLLDFAKALQGTRFKKAYVTVRDLSTYDYNKDKSNNVLAVVSAENGIEDFDGYWEEAKVFFDENINESDDNYKTYEVVVGWNGYIGVEEEYRIGAYSRVQAVNEAIDNPGCEAEMDFSVDDITDNGDGSYDVTISWYGADETYTVNADDEDDAQNQALEEAKSGFEIISVDGEEFSYDEVNESAKPKKLKESILEEKPVYMNTWKNYNEYGADLVLYNNIDGWMTIDDALAFCEKYADDEPFINDTDGVPIEISDYDNAVERLNQLKRIEEADVDEDVLKAYIEAGSYDNVDDIIDKIESGDYIFFPGVDDNKGLAEAYIEMCGGITAAVPADRIDNFFDEKDYKEENEDDFRAMIAENEGKDIDDVTDEELEDFAESVMQDEIATAKYDNRDEFFERYFDYESFGDELSYDYTFTSTGALCDL